MDRTERKMRAVAAAARVAMITGLVGCAGEVASERNPAPAPDAAATTENGAGGKKAATGPETGSQVVAGAAGAPTTSTPIPTPTAPAASSAPPTPTAPAASSAAPPTSAAPTTSVPPPHPGNDEAACIQAGEDPSKASDAELACCVEDVSAVTVPEDYGFADTDGAVKKALGVFGLRCCAAMLLTQSFEAAGPEYRWTCCAGLGVNLQTEQEDVPADIRLACTPWGPPMPPAYDDLLELAGMAA